MTDAWYEINEVSRRTGVKMVRFCFDLLYGAATYLKARRFEETGRGNRGLWFATSLHFATENIAEEGCRGTEVSICRG